MLQIDSTKDLLTFTTEDKHLNKVLDDSTTELLIGFCERFLQKWEDLMAQRSAVDSKIRAGLDPEPLVATAHIRNSDWSIAPLPHDLQERRVELVVDPNSEMIHEAMHSGAKTLVLDLNALCGIDEAEIYSAHLNIHNLIRSLEDVDTGLLMRPTLMVRPRSLSEFSSLLLYQGTPVPAFFIDLAICLSLNTPELLASGSGPYFSIAGIKNHLEARLVNDMFDHAQIELNLTRGTIKATVALDHILATFELDEILFELSHHSAGIALQKWELYNSFVELLGHRNDSACPDRRDVRNTSHLLRSISLAAIATCHKRKAHAIGWICEDLPVDSRESKYYHRIEMARKEKEIEVVDGHDGTQVSHPEMVNLATEEFNRYMPRVDQLNYLRNETVRARDLIMPFGEITTEGLQKAITRALRLSMAKRANQARCKINGRMEGRTSYTLALTQLRNWIQSPKGLISQTGLAIDIDLIKYLTTKCAEEIRSSLVVEERELEIACEEFIFGMTGTADLKKAI